MGIVIRDSFGYGQSYGILYRDSFSCKICNSLVIYLGLDKHHSDFCQSCQDELARGRGMSTRFRKMWEKFKTLERERN